MAKTYIGRRVELVGCHVTVTDRRGTRLLAQRQDLRLHSPSGFEWGYLGSGPAQLALAICADVLGNDERAVRVYQRFKEKMLAPLFGDDFRLSEELAREVIADIEREQPDA